MQIGPSVRLSSRSSLPWARLDADEPLADQTRRRFLRRGLAAGAVGAAAGAGAIAWSDRAEALDVVTTTELKVGNSQLRRALERTSAIYGGHGLQRTFWSVPTNEPVMALTFDDGPDPHFTGPILDVLDRYHVRATFNLMGHNVRLHPELVHRHVARGDELGNHTETHQDLAYLTVSGISDEIMQAHDVIEDTSGRPLKLFRPPRGIMSGAVSRVCSRLGYDILLWTTNATRPVGASTHSIVTKVEQDFSPGAIIGMHDGIGRGTFDPQALFARHLSDQRTQELRALPALLEAGMDAGYRWVTVSELLAAAGQDPPGAALAPTAH